MKPVVMPGKLLIEEFPDKTVTASGILITSDPDRAPYEGHAKVLAIGPPRKYADGTTEPSQFIPGDEVWYTNTTSSQIHLEGKIYLIIKEESVLVKLSHE